MSGLVFSHAVGFHKHIDRTTPAESLSVLPMCFIQCLLNVSRVRAGPVACQQQQLVLYEYFHLCVCVSVCVRVRMCVRVRVWGYWMLRGTGLCDRRDAEPHQLQCRQTVVLQCSEVSRWLHRTIIAGCVETVYPNRQNTHLEVVGLFLV